MGANAQVALEKFARYFDVEARLVPVSAETGYCLSPKKAMEYADEVRCSALRLHTKSLIIPALLRAEHDRSLRHPRFDLHGQLRCVLFERLPSS